jgi:hypothetical protein
MAALGGFKVPDFFIFAGVSKSIQKADWCQKSQVILAGKVLVNSPI